LGICRVYEIYTQDHLHDLFQDLKIGNRPATVIAFYNDGPCKETLKSMNFGQSAQIPSINNLILTQYEMTHNKERVWHDYEDHMDLAENLGVNEYIKNRGDQCECPILLFLPVTYANAVGEWYLNQPDIEEHKLSYWDSTVHPDWTQWVWSNLETDIRIVSNLPFQFSVTVSPHSGRRRWYEYGETVYDILGYESFTTISAYIGDTLYISDDPAVPDGYFTNNPRAIKPTSDGMNPSVEIIPALGNNTRYILMQIADGRWSFDIDGERVFTTEKLIRSRHSTTCMTHTRNLVLPPNLPQIHPIGFTKRKMPPGLHDRLLKHYRNFYKERGNEPWDKSGTQLNCIGKDDDHHLCHRVYLDLNHKERDSIANDVLKPILEEWSGKKLEHTSFYGIRDYGKGAVLRNHVDRVSTHVISVILMVSTTSLEEDWGLEVIGFDGKRYQIYLEPGDMALYEGHALIHGRPKPFNGSVFTNCYCHFKPTDYGLSANRVWRSDGGKARLKTLGIQLGDLHAR